MALLDSQRRRISLRIAYVCAINEGIDRNLGWLARAAGSERVVLGTGEGDSSNVRLVPLVGKAGHAELHLWVYGIPPVVPHESVRRVILDQSDGAVFLADGEDAIGPEREYDRLVGDLQRGGPRSAPVAVQVTGSAVPGPDWLSSHRLFEASEAADDGISETFRGILGMAWDALCTFRKEPEPLGVSKEAFRSGADGLLR